jgi:hypothetical protein
MHEMGHNQGMHHAGNQDADQYADTSNFMGFATEELKCTNSPHMRYLGWTDSEDRAVHHPATNGTMRFQLQSLASNHRGGEDLSLLSTVIVAVEGVPGNLYVAYRTNTSGDIDIGTSYANKVEIVHATSSNAITWRQPPSLDLVNNTNYGR